MSPNEFREALALRYLFTPKNYQKRIESELVRAREQIWGSQTIALFDICIFNVDANSFKTQSLQVVFEEKRKIKLEKQILKSSLRKTSLVHANN